MEENKKSKSGIVLKVLYIVAPLLMVFTVVMLIYAWYTNTLQTGELDVTTKNFTIEYTFDENTEKNVLTYTVNDIAFFDYDATEEIGYLESEARPLEIHLKNTSDSDMNYTVTFKAIKQVVTETNPTTSTTEVKSVAYVGAVLDFDGIGTTYNSIKARYTADTEQTNYKAALYDATSETTITATNFLEVKTTGVLNGKTNQQEDTADLSLYIFGIQEIDTAINSQFIYNGAALRTYTFELTIYAEPISNASTTEN